MGLQLSVVDICVSKPNDTQMDFDTVKQVPC